MGKCDRILGMFMGTDSEMALEGVSYRSRWDFSINNRFGVMGRAEGISVVISWGLLDRSC